MAIIFIDGPKQSGKSFLGNAIRDSQISKRQGGLLIDEDQDGEAKFLLEKLLNGAELLSFTFNAGQLPWKDSPTAIFIGEKKALLDEFERIVPGFTEHLSPIITIKTK